MQGYVHSYHTLTAIDGPGLRFLLFMQGCHLRCQYCHNPDTWETGIGQVYSPEEMYKIIDKYREYIQDGGVTVSGGEPILQADFVADLFELCKNGGYHTAVDTAGSIDISGNKRLLEVTDLFLLDIKHADKDKYHALTGGDLETTLNTAAFLSDNNKDMWIRYVLVPNLTDNLDDVRHLRKIIDTLKTVKKITVLPYSTLGLKKWEALGYDYKLRDTSPPSQALIKQVEDILTGNV